MASIYKTTLGMSGIIPNSWLRNAVITSLPFPYSKWKICLWEMITFAATKTIKQYCSYPKENPVPTGTGVDTTGVPKLKSVVCVAGAVLLNWEQANRICTCNWLIWSPQIKPSCTRCRESKTCSWSAGGCLCRAKSEHNPPVWYQLFQN